MRLRAVVVLLVFVVGCHPSSPSVPTHRASSSVLPSSSAHAASLKGIQFVDVTQAAGIDFVHSIGDQELNNLVESVGGGAAFLDYDCDGWLDLYVVTGVHHKDLSHGSPLPFRPKNRLYHNRGDGTFEDVTTKMNVFNPTGRAMGVAAADYDGDGFTNLYVANDAMPKELYRNEGGKRFVEVAHETGVAFNNAGEGTASMMATWGDYDGDGLFDLFVPDNTFKSLYHNEGKGFFTDQSAAAGVAAASGQ